ncbi:hypothetical protein, partial [Acidithiobacillus thiooxidans]|uniref:hypothetical protein n=1 Tax=Acidithiobacillus thiooxidans TaxID=930 RepID=UPI001C38F0C6
GFLVDSGADIDVAVPAFCHLNLQRFLPACFLLKGYDFFGSLDEYPAKVNHGDKSGNDSK